MYLLLVQAMLQHVLALTSEQINTLPPNERDAINVLVSLLSIFPLWGQEINGLTFLIPFLAEPIPRCRNRSNLDRPFLTTKKSIFFISLSQTSFLMYLNHFPSYTRPFAFAVCLFTYKQITTIFIYSIIQSTSICIP